ncbi:transglutaminaseTgpA domain-containing protein [Kocuria rhizophila]|nr:transglutaminaseTgpA domain-containing protein [Kocuria rhizophila]
MRPTRTAQPGRRATTTPAPVPALRGAPRSSCWWPAPPRPVGPARRPGCGCRSCPATAREHRPGLHGPCRRAERHLVGAARGRPPWSPVLLVTGAAPVAAAALPCSSPCWPRRPAARPDRGAPGRARAVGVRAQPGDLSAASSLWQSSGDFVARDAALRRECGCPSCCAPWSALVTVWWKPSRWACAWRGWRAWESFTLQLVPALTLPGSVSTLGLAATTLAALALLAGSRIWGATRDRRIAPAPGGLPRALLVVAGVLAVVLLVPSVMPGLFDGALPGSSLTSGRASGVGAARRRPGPALGGGRPALQLRRLGRPGAVHAPADPLGTFPGQVVPDTDGLDEPLRARRRGSRGRARRAEVTAKVTFEDYDEHWLPRPYARQRSPGWARSGWAWNPQDLTVPQRGHRDVRCELRRDLGAAAAHPEPCARHHRRLQTPR